MKLRPFGDTGMNFFDTAPGLTLPLLTERFAVSIGRGVCFYKPEESFVFLRA